jgi:hypothetical protein
VAEVDAARCSAGAGLLAGETKAGSGGSAGACYAAAKMSGMRDEEVLRLLAREPFTRYDWPREKPKKVRQLEGGENHVPLQ